MEVSILALKARQLQLIEAMMANPMMPDTQLAKQLNINNKTVGVWRKLPEFQEELQRRLSEKWKDAERLAVDQMINLASQGDFKANKYILDSLGYEPEQKIVADVNTIININIEE